MKRLFRLAADATEPRPGAVDALLERQAAPGLLLRDSAAEPRPGATERLLSRPRARPPARRRAWLLVPALAALALLALWPSKPPQILSGRLDAEERVEEPITERVHLGYQGHGALSGTEASIHIFWELGALDVEVEPHAGVALQVQTSEASVQVVGTRFQVRRGPLGTEVTLTRGHVRVTCASGELHELTAPGFASCLPMRPAGMLGRARALRSTGAPNADVLAAIDRGLSLASPGDPATGELIALRLDILVSEHRYDDARQAAEAYLQTGEQARRGEVEQILEILTAPRQSRGP